MTDAPRLRHLDCGTCSVLRDYEQGIQHVQADEGDCELPEAVGRLVGAPGVRGKADLRRCPECGTYYLYETAYEFLIGFGGSYDEQTLTRLTDEAAAAYLPDNGPPWTT